MTELTAINLAKCLTIVCLLGFAAFYGISDLRSVLYLCIHISYCLWWLLEQWIFPQRREQLFTQVVSWGQLIASLLLIGVVYSLPGLLAILNPNPIGYLEIAIALPLFFFGSLINTAADVQKMVAKADGAKLVSDGAWRSIRHVNYLGDLMRYLSFSVVAGSIWAYGLPLMIAVIYLFRINSKEADMAQKYADFAAYTQRSARLIPGIW